jgi:transcriptional regulator with XRE-family HTH domain
MDLALVARELVRAVRGKRSQTTVNRRLGCAFNQVHRWERGQTRVKWPDFVELCEVCRVDLRRALADVLGYYDDPARADLLVSNLIRPSSAAFLKEAAGLSRALVAHWVSGRASPRLEDVLLLFDRSRTALVEFVDRLVGAQTLSSLAEAVSARALRRALLTAHPNLEVVLGALELEGYRRLPAHDDRFVATAGGISVAETRTILAKLCEVGTIALRKKKYVLCERWLFTYDLRGDFGVIQPVKLHWIARGADELRRHTTFQGDEAFSYYVFSASHETARLVLDEYAGFIKRVITIVESQGEPRDTLRVLSLQLFAPRGTNDTK